MPIWPTTACGVGATADEIVGARFEGLVTELDDVRRRGQQRPQVGDQLHHQKMESHELRTRRLQGVVERGLEPATGRSAH
jgi:hypothetical protein